MPGIVKGEASSCANPLLPFFYQEDGFLADLAFLRFEVYFVFTGAKVHEAVVNLDPCELGGDKKATGYYVATLDPAALNLDPGPYEIVWYYKGQAADAEKLTAYRFEVLNPKFFRVSSRYVAYMGSDSEALTDFALEKRQQAIETASRTIERLTSRFFFPRYLTIKSSVRPSSTTVWLDEAIVGVGQMHMEVPSAYSDQPTEYALDVSTVRIFNRHLGYMLSPDDRDNPKITLVGSIDDEEISLSRFPEGVKNLVIVGVFGYTDPDGGPFGQVPQQLQEVVLGLSYRWLEDPLGLDPMLQNPGRVRMAKTRDQQIAFDTRGTAGSPGSSLTGDPRLDNILLNYCRPPHVGVAG